MGEQSICAGCHIGVLRKTITTYTRWLGRELVLLPNTRVFVCDVCGELTFLADDIQRLNALLGVEDELADDSRPAGLTSADFAAWTALSARRRASQ